MAGGHTAVDVADAGVQAAALCAVADLNARSNSMYQTELVAVLSATRQVVAGTRYELVLAAGLSQCRNNGAALDLAQCPVAAEAVGQYTTSVLVQPWLTPSCTVLTPAAIVATTTTPAATTSATAVDPVGAAPGGRQTVDPTSPAVLTAAQCAVSALNSQSNSVYQWQLQAVGSATRQIVAGTRYDLVLAAGLSACLNDGTARTLAQCPLTAAAQTFTVRTIGWLFRLCWCVALSCVSHAPQPSPC